MSGCERIQFISAFRALTDHEPFAWQERLFARMLKNDYSRNCYVPTGLGKTAIIPVWLIALAENACVVPRRLIYIVNRRTVVDQATEIARRLGQRL
jgi:CRISPR-associated endonuclease/helicase Cas3